MSDLHMSLCLVSFPHVSDFINRIVQLIELPASENDFSVSYCRIFSSAIEVYTCIRPYSIFYYQNLGPRLST